MSLATRITKIRKEKGISIDELARVSGVPKSTIAKISAGINANPTLETVKAIASALSCKLDDFDDPLIPILPKDIAKYLYDERRRVGMSRETVCAELKELGYDVTPEELARYENGGVVPHELVKVIGEKIYKSWPVMESLGFYLADEKDITMQFSLTESERELVEKYRLLDERGRANVDVILETEYSRAKGVINRGKHNQT